MHTIRAAALGVVALLLACAPQAGAQGFRNYRQAAGDQYNQPSASGARAAARACTSRRRFSLAIRGPRGRRVVRARVTLNGRPLRVVRRHGRPTVTVDLLGRRAGVVTVRIRGVSRGGRRFTRSRRFTRTYRYRTCIKRKQTRNVYVRSARTSATSPPSTGLPGDGALIVLGIGLLGAASLATAGRRVARRVRGDRA
jgi:hypothetical protein